MSQLSDNDIDILTNQLGNFILKFDQAGVLCFTNDSVSGLFRKYQVNSDHLCLRDFLGLLHHSEGQTFQDLEDRLLTQNFEKAPCIFTIGKFSQKAYLNSQVNDDSELIILLTPRVSDLTPSLSLLYKFSRLGMWTLHLQSECFEMEDNTRKFLQLPDDFLLTLDNLNTLFNQDDFPYLFEAFQQSWEHGFFDLTAKMRTYNGHWLWVRIKSVTEKNSENQPLRVYGLLQDITQMKQQELRLREQKKELELNHKLLQKAERITSLGHWIYDKSSGTYGLSEEAYHIFGLDTEEPPQSEVIEEILNPKKKNWPDGRMPASGEFVNEIRDRDRWVKINVDPSTENSQTVFGTIQDITLDVKSRQKIINSEAKQKAIVDNIPNPFCLTDKNGIIRQVNTAFGTFVSKRPHRLIGKSLYEALEFIEPKNFKSLDVEFLGGKKRTQQLEAQVKTSEGLRHISLSRSLFYNSNKKMLGAVTIIFDRTEEIRQNARLSLANKQLNLALEGARVGFFIYDVKRDINYWDPRSSEIFGFSSEAQVGTIRDFFDCVHPEDLHNLKQEWETDYEGMSQFENRFRIFRKSEVRYIKSQGTIERDDSGQPSKVLGIHLDETEQVWSRKRLEDSEAKYRRIFEQIKDGYLLMNLSGEILDANPAAAKLLGYGYPSDLIGRRFQSLTKESPAVLDSIQRKLIKNKELANVKLELVRKENTSFMADFQGSMTVSEGFGIVEATFRDMTRDLKAQSDIMKATFTAEDNQRKRIALELHDSVQQILITSKMNFEAIKDKLNGLDPTVKETFDLGLKLLTNGLEESRTVAHDLMPPAVEDFGVVAAMESLMHNLNRSSEINFHFYTNISNRRFDRQVELSLYRILQEACNNILKFSKASEVQVHLMIDKNILTLTIEDDGKGFDVRKASASQSLGLTSMKSRAAGIGAHFELESRKTGTLVLVELTL